MAMIPYSPRSKARSTHSTSSRSSGSYYDHNISSRSSLAQSPSFRQPRSSMSDYTSASSASSTFSTQTFGSPQRIGYTSKQPPADWFYSSTARAEWESAPRRADGTRVRRTRTTCEGYENPRGVGNERTCISGSNGRDCWDAGEDWDDEGTVGPDESISQTSSSRSRGRGWEGEDGWAGYCGRDRGSGYGGQSGRRDSGVGGYRVVEVKPDWVR